MDDLSGRIEEGAGSSPAQEAYAHPVAAFFHVFFKGAAIVWYIFCTFVTDSFVNNFVICVILLALDFWTVKNVTGRLLVGLRWWNEVAEDGSSKWQFESLAEGQRSINIKDKGVFWTALYATPLLWVLLAIPGVFQFELDYLLIVLVGIILAGTNMYGYYKCSKEQKQKMESMARGAMSQGLMNAFSRFM